ncbi:MAG: EamA family transporter [Clostridia bacterium]|nr:EamA family transporter [Clostridia bacterium]
MTYLIPLGCSFLFSVQFAFNKHYEARMGQSLKASAYFCLTMSAAAAFLVLAMNRFAFAFSPFSCVMALLLAADSMLCTVCSLRAVHLGSLSVYTLFLMLGGMLVPSVLGVAVLGETIGLFRKLGFLLIFLALLVPVFDRKSRQKSSAHFFVFCFLLFLLNGANSCITKLHQINAQAVDTNSFLAMNYVFEFAAAGLFLLCANTGKRKNLSLDKKSVAFAVAYALVNAVGSFGLVSCAKTLDASLLYPLITGGTILFSALVGFVLFKEKPTVYSAIGMVLAVAATVLYAL